MPEGESECVCVRVRERESLWVGERERDGVTVIMPPFMNVPSYQIEKVIVCVLVSVFARELERERELKRGTWREEMYFTNVLLLQVVMEPSSESII